MQVTLGKEHISFPSRLDMRNRVAIELDVNRALQSRKNDFAAVARLGRFVEKIKYRQNQRRKDGREQTAFRRFHGEI